MSSVQNIKNTDITHSLLEAKSVSHNFDYPLFEKINIDLADYYYDELQKNVRKVR